MSLSADLLAELMADGQWVCPLCTVVNPPGSVRCSVCTASPRLSPPPAPAPRAPALPKVPSTYCLMMPGGGWACSVCTMENPAAANACTVCGLAPIFSPSASVPKPAPLAPPSLPPGPPPPPSLPPAGTGEAAGATAGGAARDPALQTADPVPVSVEEDSRAQKRLASILDWTTSSGELFVDPDFSPSRTSLGPGCGIRRGGEGGELVSGVTWLRPADIRPRRDQGGGAWTVFQGKPHAEDINQGSLGVCWLLSAMAVLADRNGMVERLFRTPEFSSSGVYQIQLYLAGVWRTMTVDDVFPCDPASKTLAFSSADRGQLWVPLLEKALAKAAGSYKALEGGSVCEGLRRLTGVPVSELNLHSGETTEQADARARTNGSSSGGAAGEADLIWGVLMSWFDSGFMMGASCTQREDAYIDFKAVGLRANHAYSVLQVVQDGIDRLIRLRNPWGSGSWNGRWGDSWSGWTAAKKDRLGAYGSDGGIFWMCLEDFRQYFSSVAVAKCHQGWSHVTTPLPLPLLPPRTATPVAAAGASRSSTPPLPSTVASPSFGMVSVLELTCLSSTWAELTIVQPGIRDGPSGRDLSAMSDIGLCVVKVVGIPNALGEGASVQYVQDSRRVVKGWVNCEVFLEEGQRYIITPLAFNHLTGFGPRPVVPTIGLEVHSAQPVLVDVVGVPVAVYAMAIVERTVKRGHRREVFPDHFPGVYTHELSMDAGAIIVAENRNPSTHFRVTVDCSRQDNVVASRGEFLTQDCLPPLTRQILVVLSHCRGDLSYMWSSSMKFSADPRDREAHEPPVDTPGLHMRLPL